MRIFGEGGRVSILRTELSLKQMFSLEIVVIIRSSFGAQSLGSIIHLPGTATPVVPEYKGQTRMITGTNGLLDGLDQTKPQGQQKTLFGKLS